MLFKKYRNNTDEMFKQISYIIKQMQRHQKSLTKLAKLNSDRMDYLEKQLKSKSANSNK